MANTLQVRRGAKLSLPTLDAGELGLCTDTYEVFVGDGSDNHQFVLYDADGKITSVTDPTANQDVATKLYVDTNAISHVAADVGIGGVPGPTFPTLRRCTIATDTGIITPGDGPDLMLNGTDDNSPDQEFIALKLWNMVWNDVADFRKLNDELIYGKCYYDTTNGAKICDTQCQKSVIGIASNTFGQGLGFIGAKSVPIAISGWVLAFVDKEYEIGTPLTNDENGDLTEITFEEKKWYPERLVAIYRNKEVNILWGPKDKEIEVNNRYWVKIK